MQDSTQNPVFQHAYRIYLEDTDAGGIVYHANHLKLFERCRRDWLRQLGMTSYFYAQHTTNTGISGEPDIHFVVSDLSVRYFQPLLLDSLVMVTVTSCQPKSASLLLVQQIYVQEQLLASAKITLACVQSVIDEEGSKHIRPARLPQVFLAMLK